MSTRAIQRVPDRAGRSHDRCYDCRPPEPVPISWTRGRLWTPPITQAFLRTVQCMWSGAVVYPACWCSLSCPRLLARMEIRGSGPYQPSKLESFCPLSGFPDPVSLTVCPYPSSVLPTSPTASLLSSPFRRLREPGRSPSSSSAPRRCAPSCWPAPPRPTSSASVPTSWPTTGPWSGRVGLLV